MAAEVERPIRTAKEDRLYRGEFVQRLVSALVGEDGRATGMVVGITGPWGSGKSSIINMVAETIRDEHPDAVVVQFNPWLINSRDDLITSFFAEVTAALSATGKNTGPTQLIEKLTGFAKTFFDYGKRLAPLANLLAPVAGSMTAAGFDALAQSVSDGNTVYDLRKRFERELEESKTEIVVLVDEIDRLSDAEVAVVAQLVRAIADFPHFSYLLAYDAQRVAEALGGSNTERGQAYLEKIVQLSVPLPGYAGSDQANSPRSILRAGRFPR
jgi:predicted KAP-like P-loop ATPase